jgi:hypothetical protein
MNVIPFSFLHKPIVASPPAPTPPGPQPHNAYDAGNAASYPGSGTVWTNIGVSGSASASLFNGVGYSPANGGSLTFNGTNQYARVTYNSTFDFSGNNYAINAWVKYNSIGANIVTSKDTNGSNFDWCIYLPNSSTIANYSNGTSTNVTRTISPALSTGTWYQLTIAVNASSNTLFVNGVQLGTAGAMNTSNASQTALTIGCASWNNPNAFVNGNIALVEYYKIGLSSAQILDKFNFYKTRFGY